jgi:hypothetical protein
VQSRRTPYSVITDSDFHNIGIGIIRHNVVALAATSPRESGELRARHFAVVHDCGQVINPDGVKNQIEGNVVQTLSRTLGDESRLGRLSDLDLSRDPGHRHRADRSAE